MFLYEALCVCIVYEKCYINKVALPCLYVWVGYSKKNGARETNGLLPADLLVDGITKRPALVWSDFSYVAQMIKCNLGGSFDVWLEC